MRCAAAREVILAAGRDPVAQAAAALRHRARRICCTAYGIQVVADSPNVGQNLREHRYLQTVYRVTGGSMNQAAFAGARPARSVLQYGLSERPADPCGA